MTMLPVALRVEVERICQAMPWLDPDDFIIDAVRSKVLVARAAMR